MCTVVLTASPHRAASLCLGFSLGSLPSTSLNIKTERERERQRERKRRRGVAAVYFPHRPTSIWAQGGFNARFNWALPVRQEYAEVPLCVCVCEMCVCGGDNVDWGVGERVLVLSPAEGMIGRSRRDDREEPEG